MRKVVLCLSLVALALLSGCAGDPMHVTLDGLTMSATASAEVPINVSAIAASETEIFDLSVPDSHYTIEDLVIKSVDPGANHIHINLYKLVNGVSTLIRQFEINQAGLFTEGISGPYTRYYGTDEMFEREKLAGDDIRLTAQVSGGGPYAVTGSYSYTVQ